MSGTQLSSPHISTSFKAQKPGEMKWLGYVAIFGHIWALIWAYSRFIQVRFVCDATRGRLVCGRQ